MREKLPVDPADLFAEMLRLADRGDWQHLDRSLVLLEPLRNEVDSGTPARPGRQLVEAVEAQDVGTARVAVRQFIAASAAQVLDSACVATDSSVRRSLLRSAFSEFLSLSRVLRSENFGLHREIERSFRTANSAASSEGGTWEAQCSGTKSLLHQVAAPLEGRP